jgi:hypothetical protein
MRSAIAKYVQPMKRTSSVFLILIMLVISGHAKTIYVSPDGTGDGSSRSTPAASFSWAVPRLNPGDTLLLLDGEYHQRLVLEHVSGTLVKPITIRADNVCGAFINAEQSRDHAVLINHCSYINIDGIKAGNSTHGTWDINWCDHLRLTRCLGFNAGYHVARDDGVVQNTYADNCHIFGIAYSHYITAVDIWAWGSGRYAFVYFQCTNSVVRRGVFRPVDPEIGYGYDRCPHSGFNLYDCDNCRAENCIAFETRVHPQSTHNEGNPWGLVQGGMVFDDHTTPSGYNYIYGCFDLDNGQWRSEVPRSNSAVHLMSKWSGEFEDVVIWNNAHDYGIIRNTSGVTRLPERALIGSPSNTRQNTIVDYNMNHRYINGVLTDFPLWPWPHEDIIKAEFGMDETMTEYVTRNLENYMVIDSGEFIPASGLQLKANSFSIKSDTSIRLETTIYPEEATNRMVTWESADSTIVRVDPEGLVTARDTGTTTIVATSVDGGFRDACTVTVIPEDEKPSAPRNLDTLRVTFSMMKLIWNASTDNVGVVKYEVYLDSTWKKTVTDTVAQINYLKCETTFSVTVKAFDRMGNRSDASEVLEVTMKECPSTDLHAFQYDNSKLSIYPQPSSGTVTIESESDIEYIEIKNLTGMTVVAGPVSGKSMTLDRGSVGTGLYVLTAIIDGEKINRVFMFD